jgi:hypothetical protein
LQHAGLRPQRFNVMRELRPTAETVLARKRVLSRS